jgi:hypothetical protein
MKKIFASSLLISLLSFVVPYSIFADDANPTFSLTIVEQTWGGDENFSFDLSSFFSGGVVFKMVNVARAQSQTTYNIQTLNLKGIQVIPDLPNLETDDTLRYMLNQQPKDGWTLDSRRCVSDNQSQTYTYDNYYKYFVSFVPFPNSHITCTFTNISDNARNPVLIVPGIMGTEIFKETEKLWPDVGRMLVTPGDKFMNPLAYKNEDATPIDTSLSIGNVINKEIKFDYSEALMNELINQGYIKNQNLFLFPYDWRKDLADVADNEFKNKINELLDIPGVGKIDVIAHSQGGLVFKRFLYENPAYLYSINKAVFVGTPNLGAPKAAKALLYGDSMGVSFAGMGLDPAEVKFIGHNMPAVYELLPSYSYFEKNNGIGYLGNAELDSNLPLYHITTKDFGQTYDYLSGGGGLNSDLISRADSFHDDAYDNFDFTGTGIKAYNIVGCQDATITKIVIMPNGDYKLDYGPGDTTVPIASANNLGGALTFYALKADHGQMLSQDGIRQQIVSIIAGNGSLVSNNITTIPTDCRFDGRQVSVHSPVDLNIYEGANHVGPNPDGTFDYQIEGVQYDTIGEEKFAFLPAGHDYTVKLIPSAQINNENKKQFNFYSSVIADSQITSDAYYNNVPVSNTSEAMVVLSGGGNNQVLELDSDGDGVFEQTYEPSPVLGTEELKDSIAPVCTSTLAGLMGQPGFYWGDVTINLNATDPVVEGQPTSGVLTTFYKLDNDTTYRTYTGPIGPITNEGEHYFAFFSTDRAGNNEPEQTITFTIDKTPPELIIQFNPALKDLQFIATDTLSTTLATSSLQSGIRPFKRFPFPIPWAKVKDEGNVITATDAAGNQTVLTLQDKDRKRSLKADIKSLSYNGKKADISKTNLHFDWLFDKKGNLKLLVQNIQAKKDFNISAIYDGKKTILLGKDSKGKINKTLAGLVLLKIATNKGDLEWSY